MEQIDVSHLDAGVIGRAGFRFGWQFPAGFQEQLTGAQGHGSFPVPCRKLQGTADWCLFLSKSRMDECHSNTDLRMLRRVLLSLFGWYPLEASNLSYLRSAREILLTAVGPFFVPSRRQG